MAAYSFQPTLETQDGDSSAKFGVECWRGPVAHFIHIAEAAVEAATSIADAASEFEAEVTLESGKHQRYASLAELRRSGLGETPEKLIAIRVTVTVNGELESVVAARPKIPGLTGTVTGREKARVLGLAHLLYNRAQSGYRDRLGTWRFLVALLVVYLPAVVVGSVGLPDGFVIAGTLIGLPLFLFVLSVLQVRTPVEFLPPQPEGEAHESRAQHLWGWLTKTAGRRWVVRGASLFGLVLLGIATDKISDAIHFP